MLEGIQVLDLVDERASFCSRLLAELGACVRSIVLDLEVPEGRGTFFKGVEQSDIVIESFPPGDLQKLGLGFEVLSEINPGLILASLTSFGQSGPRRHYKSCDLVASAYGGQMYVTGSPSMPPLKAYGDQSYNTSSLFAAIGIVLALRKRRQSGRGDHIDISLQGAVTATLDHVMVRYFSEGIVARRQGNRSWNGTSFIVSCRDGHLYLTLSPWETLVEWMDTEGMAGDLAKEKWKEESYRLQHIDHIAEVIEKWTRTHSARELFELGQRMQFPWAPVCSPCQVLESPQLRARDFFPRWQTPKERECF